MTKTKLFAAAKEKKRALLTNGGRRLSSVALAGQRTALLTYLVAVYPHAERRSQQRFNSSPLEKLRLPLRVRC